MMGVNLLLVGCGKMGGALLSGWRAAGMAAPGAGRVVVVDPGMLPPDGGWGDDAVSVVASAAGIPGDLDPAVIILAVKPQMMDAVLPDYRRYAGRSVFLSIAAGKTIAYFQDHLGADAALVRAMPNTPAAIGRGISGVYATPGVGAEARALCDRLLQAAGPVVWLEDEGQIDAVTGVSGSGPAYVFHLVEALAQAGVAAGLPADLAMRLARETVSGAGELLHRSPESAEQLRRDVTSPKGTTQAALDVLMAPDGLPALMTRTVAAAAARSRELGQPTEASGMGGR